MQREAPLLARFKDLRTSDMKEILLQRMLEENYDKGHANHRVAYEALQDSIRRDESASGALGTTGASDSVQAPPPPPPSSSTHQGGHLNHLSPEDKKILTTAVNLWTRNLVIRQCVEDFQLGIKSYQTQLNLTKPRWEATGFEFKHDFTVIDSPRAVIFRDRYGVQNIIRTNPGMNTRFWTKKTLSEKISCFALSETAKDTRIFRNPETFVVDGFEKRLLVTAENRMRGSLFYTLL
ncbi:hypothetical protein Tco_0007833 [Tanacetum coccineum]